MKRRKSKEKLPLILSTILSVMAVFVGGVSTFAWFQAYASVRVRTTENSTIVTVNSPYENFTLDIYRYNSGNPYNPSSTSSATWSDFSLYDGPSIPVTNDFWPGMSITYCLVSSPVVSRRELTIDQMAATGFTSSSDNRYLCVGGEATTEEVDIRWATLVFGKGLLVEAEAEPTDSDLRDFLGKDSGDIAESKYSCPRGESESISAVAEADPQGVSKRCYLFFTVHFSDDASTWFKHVDGDGSLIYGSPSFEEDTTSYWEPYNSGSTANFSSEPYRGLRFKINSMTVA